MSVQITPELIGSIAGLVTAIGVAIKNVLDVRRERRSRRRQLENLARAASKGPKAVAELVDDAERTGEFTRLTGLPDRRRRSRARAPEAAPPDT